MKQSTKKSRPKKRVAVVRHSFEGGIDEILDRLRQHADHYNKKLNEVVAAHNAISEHLTKIEAVQQNIARWVSTEFGKSLAEQKMFGNSVADAVTHVDNNVMALSEVVREVFGQLTQIDRFFKKVTGPDNTPKLTDEEVEDVKAEATDWYRQVTETSFATVQRMREVDEQIRMEKVQQAKEATERAASEANSAEQELRRAAFDDLGVQQFTGGVGAEYPDGADVFGG